MMRLPVPPSWQSDRMSKKEWLLRLHVFGKRTRARRQGRRARTPPHKGSVHLCQEVFCPSRREAPSPPSWHRARPPKSKSRKWRRTFSKRTCSNKLIWRDFLSIAQFHAIDRRASLPNDLPGAGPASLVRPPTVPAARAWTSGPRRRRATGPSSGRSPRLPRGRASRRGEGARSPRSPAPAER